MTEETDPKRVSVWEIPAEVKASAPRLVRELFGANYYGEGAYMLDPARPQRITSGNDQITWDVDLARGTFRPLELPLRTHHPEQYNWYAIDADFPFGNNGGRPDWEDGGSESWLPITRQTIPFQGRTIQWYTRPPCGFAVVGEQVSGGGWKPLAAFGTIFNYVWECGQYSDHWIPPALLLAAAKDRPNGSGWPRPTDSTRR